MKTLTAIEWKRAKRNDSGCRQWRTRDGRYAVHAGDLAAAYGCPLVYTAWARVRRRDVSSFVMIWVKVSRHRSRRAAMAACKKHDRVAATKGA